MLNYFVQGDHSLHSILGNHFMDPRIKADWIVALRSGQYKQAQSVLCDGNGGYCCLGVLCVAVGAEFVDIEAKLMDAAELEPLIARPILNNEVLAESNGFDETLSYSFLHRVGIETKHQDELVNLNDCEDKNFSEIADWIEENL